MKISIPLILASDFTGMIELLAWFFGSILYGIGLVLCWLCLAIPRTREFGRWAVRILSFGGVMLGLILLLSYRTMILYNHRNEWSEYLYQCGISLGLVLAAWITQSVFRKRSADKT